MTATSLSTPFTFQSKMTLALCGVLFASFMFLAQASAADVEIFTRPDCAECFKAKAYLNAHHIGFVERDVAASTDTLKEFYARGGVAVPWLFVKGRPLVGFYPKRLNALLAPPAKLGESAAHATANASTNIAENSVATHAQAK